MSLKNILSTGAFILGMSGIAGCSVEYTPDRFKYAEIEAPENLWEAYQKEDIPHNKTMWEAYQTLVNRVNDVKFDENVPEGKMIKIPDMDKDGFVWSNGQRYVADMEL